MEKVETISLTFEKGLVTRSEPSTAPTNSLRDVLNWHPEPEGGLRTRSRWIGTAGETGKPAAPFGVGIGWQSLNRRVYTANADSTSQITLRYSPPDMSAHTLADTITGVTDAMLSPVAIIAAGIDVWYNHVGFANLRNTTLGATTGPSGRALAEYRNHLWVGGPSSARGRLLFSELGNYSSWPGSNFIDPGGEGPLGCLAPFLGGLVIGKMSSLHLLTGSGTSDFEVRTLDGGGDCAYGNTMVATPYGLAIVGWNGVYLWGGGPVQKISQEVDFRVAGNFASCAYADEQLFISDVAGAVNPKVWTFDFRSEAWGQERVGSAMAEGTPQMMTSSIQATSASSFAGTGDVTRLLGIAAGGDSFGIYRFPSTNRGADLTVYPTITYRARTQDLWLGSSRSPGVPRHLYLRLRQRGAEAGDLTVTPYYNGTAGTVRTVTSEGDGKVFRRRVDLDGTDSYGFFVEFTATGPPAFDIEEVLLDYEVEAPR